MRLHRDGRRNRSSHRDGSGGRESRPAYRGSPGYHLRSVVLGDLAIALCLGLGRVTNDGLDCLLHHGDRLGNSHRLGGLWSGLCGGMSRDLDRRGHGRARGRGIDAVAGMGQERVHRHGEGRGHDLRPGCETVGGGRGHGDHHLFAFAPHDFLQEMVSASLWAEPFLVSVTVAQQDCHWW